ncbi:MAG: YggU family protein [Thermoplasmata archaeon]|nr:MAG: YggU family protein [Thermoplasmata archaeon]
MEYKEALSISKKGTILKIHVTPNSTQNMFPAGYNKWRKSIEIKTRSEAKNNRANKEIINKISKYFNVPTENITIITGKKSREKNILIKNLPINQIIKKLEENLP